MTVFKTYSDMLAYFIMQCAMIIGGIATADVEAFGMQTQPQVGSRHWTCITVCLCLQQITTIRSSESLQPELDISETNMPAENSPGNVKFSNSISALLPAQTYTAC